ncbi:MAG: Gfo/Idh/MocA family oxidoreductase [bacterium]|jgi:predicted dehydrogenase|nr:Gfo/Idh/MocA family oxidoreductase [bacterium]
MNSIVRRDFLRRTALAGAALALPSSFLLKSSAAAEANDAVQLGIVGFGGRGGELARSFTANQAKIVAIADPDAARSGKAEAMPGVKAYEDLRQLVEDPNVDAVVIATCNHWHCLAAILAMQAGKDVYVEKPLAHSQWEGRQVVNAARKYNKIVQLGTQQRSDPLQAAAKAFLHEEKALGKILYVQTNRLGVRGSIGKRETPLPIPESVNYNLWLGPAEEKPIFRDQLQYDWHWDYNTGNGEMGNWGVHVLDDVRNVVYRDSVTLPHRILSVGGRMVWNDAGETPNVHFVCFDTGDIPTVIALSNLPQSPDKKGDWKMPAGRPVAGPGSGYVVVCEGGYYLGQRGSGKAVDLEGKEIRSFRGGDMMKLHTANFLEAVKSRDHSSLNAEIAVGHDTTGWCNLANIASRVGGEYSREKAQSILPNLEGWGKLLENMEAQLQEFGIAKDSAAIQMSPILSHDPQTERFIGEHADKANQYLKRIYRAPFAVPEIV